MLLTTSFDNLHQVLRDLYTSMMPMCADMAGVAKGIAGLGALFYVAHRVWQSLSRAEPIDVYPLLRPFLIGLCIMFFPTFVLGSINGILSPVVKGTNNMLHSQTFDMKEYRKQKDRLEYEQMRRNPETAWIVNDEELNKQLGEMGVTDAPQITGMFLEIGLHAVTKLLHTLLREIFELLFEAAALVIDTLRTFFLIVLAILGPIAFSISVWDGFQASMTQWLTRYISVYLWLPISDLFSAMLARINTLIIQRDTDKLIDLNFIPDGSSTVYIIFLIIGIVGYFTIPSVANWVIQAGGMGNYNKNVNSTATKAGGAVAGAAGAAVGNVTGRLYK